MRSLWKRLVGEPGVHPAEPLIPELNRTTTLMELALTAVALGLGVVLLIHALVS
jgi:hypothetical protein